jgi:L-alanine-DL-glutamate epimerase-like enolase superfamily enzyme
MSSRKWRIEHLRLEQLRIPFKTAFRHASAERAETETAWVEAVTSDGIVGSGESCPRSYVTGETLDSIRDFLLRHEAPVRDAVDSVASLRDWVAAHQHDIDANPAGWCAIELAILDALGKREGAPVEALLSVPSLTGRAFHYSAVLGDAIPEAFHAMAERYWRTGFRDFKVKLSNDSARDRDKMAVFDAWPRESRRLRADANNLWKTSDEAIAGLQGLAVPFFAIEEPIGRDRHRDLSEISRALNCAVILDESFLRRDQLPRLTPPSSQWLINVRVSKMGGLIRSLDVVEAARAAGIGVIIGAQVGETSLLTRAALTVATAAGDALVAQEGAFGTLLLERDVCDPPLMFGAGGILGADAHPMLTLPGLGIGPR